MHYVLMILRRRAWNRMEVKKKKKTTRKVDEATLVVMSVGEKRL